LKNYINIRMNINTILYSVDIFFIPGVANRMGNIAG